MKCNFLKIDAIAFDHLWKHDISRHYAATPANLREFTTNAKQGKHV